MNYPVNHYYCNCSQVHSCEEPKKRTVNILVYFAVVKMQFSIKPKDWWQQKVDTVSKMTGRCLFASADAMATPNPDV